MRTYKELSRLQTFDERYNYLRQAAKIGESTFGGHRYLNQLLYRSKAWKEIRDAVIIRDEGRDLGVEGYEIERGLLVHHIEPLSIGDIEEMSHKIFDLNNLITVSYNTHQAIHFGSSNILLRGPVERKRGDTSPWLQS